MRVQLGNERYLQDVRAWRGRALGFITHHAAVDACLQLTADRLLAAGAQIVALYGPEHGIRGEAPAGQAVASTRDPESGVPIWSLYGEHRQPTAEMLEGVDVLVCELQDSGSRYYTNTATMALAMEAAAQHGLPFVVLDRPNPIGGVRLEGNILDPAFRSFVGTAPIPMRHGLTLGELAHYFRALWNLDLDLTVVPMEGWQRPFSWPQTNLSWVPPSPNSTGFEMCLLYPGTCLLEGTNLTEGRGTTKPYELVGAPYVDPERWAERLNGLALPGVRFRPAYFRPMAGKYAGEPCGGVQVHITQPSKVTAVRIGLELISTCRSLWPEAFAFLSARGAGHCFFDLLCGGEATRLALEEGVAPQDLVAAWDEALREFAAERERHLLY